MTVAAFSDRAREAIYAVCDGRCAGCSTSSPLTAQHRRARGRGGSSDRALAHPANGVPLCGSGTTGCHGWAEVNPHAAALLGWRLDAGDDPLDAPFWTRAYAWRRYSIDDRTLLHAYVHPADLDRQLEREAALDTYRAWAGR